MTSKIASQPASRTPRKAPESKAACRCGHREDEHREVAPRHCDAVEARRVCGCEAFDPAVTP